MRYASDYAAADTNEAVPADGPMSEAQSSLSLAYDLHNQLDELERRIFGDGPKPVGEDSSAVAPGQPPLAHMLKHTRQRLDSAASRMGRILGRL